MIVIQTATSMGRGQWAATGTSRTHPAPQAKPWNMWDHISHGHTTWVTENIMHYIFIYDNKSSVPGAGRLTAVYAAPHTCIGERVPWKLSSLPANNRADRRIPQIAEHKSDDCIYYQPSFKDYNVSTPSHPRHRDCTKSVKHASHNHHLIVKRTRIKYIVKKKEAKYLYQCFVLSNPLPHPL